MGVCTSCEATAVGNAPTVKIVLADGTLKEFDRPVRAGSAGLKADPDRWFVCDADEMEIDGYVGAVGADEWLRPGRIYFVLPKPMLKSRLRAEDLAKLAVKANAALVKNSRKCGKSSVAPLAFSSLEEDAVGTTAGERRRRSGGGRGRKFASELGAITE